MRISYSKEDPGYANRGWAAEIYLDGKRAVDVLTADEERGLVVVYDRDANDELQFDKETGRVLVKNIFGRVWIRMPGEHIAPEDFKDISSGWPTAGEPEDLRREHEPEDLYRARTTGEPDGSIDLAGPWAQACPGKFIDWDGDEGC